MKHKRKTHKNLRQNTNYLKIKIKNSPKQLEVSFTKQNNLPNNNEIKINMFAGHNNKAFQLFSSNGVDR